MRKETGQKAADVQNELDGAKSRIPQFQSHYSHVQAGLSAVLRRLSRLSFSIEELQDQFVEKLHLGLHDYLNATVAAFKVPTTFHGVYLMDPFVGW